MIRGVSTVLGVGLMAVWALGLGDPLAPGWLTWLIGVAALGAFATATFAPNYRSRTKRASYPLFVALGLYTLWLAGMATLGGTAWMPWACFGFGSVFLVLSVLSSVEKFREPGVPGPSFEEEQMRHIEEERMKRSA